MESDKNKQNVFKIKAIYNQFIDFFMNINIARKEYDTSQLL
jgi:hypothetical protein